MLRQALAVSLTLLCAGCVTEERYPLESSMVDFKSPHAHAANDGYRELAAAGARSIPFLLDAADLQKAFAGNAYKDSTSSLLAVPPPSQGIVALYVIEVIRLEKDHPHMLPELLAEDGSEVPDAQRQAASAYHAWWKGLNAPTRESIRAAKDPLEGTGLRWR